MARNLEELVLRLDADSRSLRRELGLVDRKGKATAKALQTSFQKAGGGIAALGRVAGTAAGGLALLAGTAGLGAAVKGSLDFADAIEKTSSKLGVSTDALQEWRFAADQSGVEMRTLEMAAQRFTRRAAEAAMGTGEARDAIAELGISLKDSNGQIRSTEDLFRDAMRALGEVDEPARRLRLAFKLFDSEGAVLVNLADNFERLTAEAREMGVVIDAEVIDSASRMKGQVDALATATKADLTAALVALGPVLVASARGVSALAGEMSYLVDLFRDVGDRSADNLRARLEAVTETIAKQRREFDLAVANQGVQGVTSFGPQPGPISGDLQVRLETINGLLREQGDLQQALADLERKRAAARPPPATADPLGTPESKAAESARKSAEKAAEKEAERRRKGIEALNLEADAQRRLFEAKLEGQEVYEATQVALQAEAAARQLGIDLLSDEGAAVEDAIAMREKFAAQIAALDDAGDSAFSGLQSDIEGLSSSMSDAFARMVTEGEITFKALGDAFLQQFISRAVEGLIFSPIFKALGGGGGILGAAFGGGKAAGGTVTAGTPYVVGEKGPEVFVPRGSGTIVPNHALSTPRLSSAPQAATGGVQINVVNSHAGAEVQAREETGPYGVRRIQIMVAEMTERNILAGRHDKSMRGRYGTRPRGRSGL